MTAAPAPLPAPAATTAAGPSRSGRELFSVRAGVTGLATHAYQG